MGNQDPDPSTTPDLEPGGGVRPGATPPESGETSGLSAPEPSTTDFPATGTLTMVWVVLLVVAFLAVAVGLVVLIVG